MGRKIITVLSFIIAFSMLITIIPIVVADEDSLAVFLFIEHKETYSFNDTVNISVHVLDKGDYSDPIPPGAVSVLVNNSVDIPLSKKSTGIYEGTYKLNISDAIPIIDDWYLFFRANASKNPRNWDSSEKSIVILGEESSASEFSVIMYTDDSKDRTPKPGDTVELTVNVKLGDTYVDPDELTILDPDDPDPEAELPYTRTDVGIYTTSYQVDPDIKENTIISVGATATYNEEMDFYYVDLLINFLNIWLHNATVENTSASFEIWVADLEGKAEPGAFINIIHPVGKTGTTDKDGMALFTMNYSEPSSGIVTLRGYVTAPSEETQTFSWGFYVGEPLTEPPATPGKFRVFPLTTNLTVAPEDTFKANFVAYNNSVLWADKIIYYYVVFINDLFSTGGEILYHGSVTTEDNGRFNLSFEAPANKGNIRIYFESGVEVSTSSNDNLRYKEDAETIITVKESETGKFIEEGLNISIGEFLIGGKVDITATLSGSSGFIGRASWIILDDNWTKLGGAFFSYLNPSNNEFKGSVYIPEFLPLDQRYAIEIVLIDPTTGDTYYNYVVATPTGIAQEDDKKKEPLDLLFLILLIIMVIIIMALLAFAFKRPKGEESEEKITEIKKEGEEESEDDEAEEGEEDFEEESEEGIDEGRTSEDTP